MFLNAKSIAKITTANMAEATITIIALLCS